MDTDDQVNFVDPDRLPSEEDVASIERELGFAFPIALRSFFLEHNGADPDPYVLISDGLRTVVNETLPLVSGCGRGTAVDSYKELVLKKGIVDQSFFPFAIDAGGDYFFVNCGDPTGEVYFFRSDTADDDMRGLQRVASSLAEFWGALVSEEE